MSAQGRLMSESQLLAKQANPQVFAVPDAQDIMHWTAVVVGPPNTPYSRGMFHFDLRFPNDYPNLPPTVVLRTTSSSTVRFNPNLYNNGKVCLSILGTWRAEAGEQWSSVQNVHSVLMSIQSLMHDKPYHNEPNFEKDDGSGDVQRYNEKIAHETLRVAVVEVMEDTIEGKSTSNGAEPCFDDLRKQLFLMQYACYLATLGEWEQLEHARDGRPFRMMPFECLANGMKGQFAWRALRGRLEAVHGHVLEEISGWRQKGKEQAALVRAASAIGLAPAVSSLQEQLAHLKLEPPEGVSIGADGDNALTVELTVFGPEGTSWEEGCFAVEIVYPPDYPDSSPRVRFTSGMFHPNISADGFPYISALVLWHTISPRQRMLQALISELRRLLVTCPDPEPITHLNPEAARLCFSAADADRKEYQRRVRRCAQRSNED